MVSTSCSLSKTVGLLSRSFCTFELDGQPLLGSREVHGAVLRVERVLSEVVVADERDGVNAGELIKKVSFVLFRLGDKMGLKDVLDDFFGGNHDIKVKFNIGSQ